MPVSPQDAERRMREFQERMGQPNYDGDVPDEIEGEFDVDEKPKKGGKAEPGKVNMIREMWHWLSSCYELRYNQLAGYVEFRRARDLQAPFRALGDRDLNTITVHMLEETGFRATGTLLRLIESDRYIESYHPLRAYFERIDRDGPPPERTAGSIERLARSLRLGSMPEATVAALKDLGHSPQSAVTQLIRRWVLGCVGAAIDARANHVCLVLQGGQGRFKTTWLNRLCPDEVSDYRYTGKITHLLQNNQVADYLAEKWFVNIDDELEQVHGKDYNALKSIITATDVTNRKAYARRSARRARVAVFMASVNGERPLRDTENRRYLVLPILSCEVSAMPPIAEVWAEAYRLYQAGEQHYFTAEEGKLRDIINEQFSELSVEHEMLSRHFEPSGPGDAAGVVWHMTATEIMVELKRYSNNMNLNFYALQRAMKRLGFEGRNKRRPGRSHPEHCFAVKRYDSDQRQMVPAASAEDLLQLNR